MTEERKNIEWPPTLGDALRQGLRPVIPAPMAGYTDAIYRQILREHGTRYLTYPLFSAHAVLANKEDTYRIFEEIENEGDLTVQLFGENPDVLHKAAKVVEEKGAVGIDFNLGCSVKKIARSGGGAILLKDCGKIRDCLTALKDAVKIPLSVKTRIGYGHDDKESGLETLEIAQELGFSHLTIHGRVFKQGFAGPADWDFISEFKKRASIPVIGNGDVTGHKSCLEMFESTGVDGVMIGRGIIGNPFIVRDCQDFVSDGVIPPVRIGRQLLTAALEHYKIAVDFYGPERGNKEMRKWLAKYIQGIRGATSLRIRINKVEDPANVIKLIEEALTLQPSVGSG